MAERGEGVRDARQVGKPYADRALQAVAGDIERPVGSAVLEADCLTVGKAAVLGFELPVDQAMGGPKFLPVARLLDDRHLDLGAVAEVVVPGGVAEPPTIEVRLATFGQTAKADLQSAEFAVAQSAWLRLRGNAEGG